MKIKICGITNFADAEYAAKEGANYIGINFSPLSKRCVSIKQGREIAKAALENGAEPVAIFVDESFDEMIEIHLSTNIKTLQLHGKGSKNCLNDLLNDFTIIYSHGMDVAGKLVKSNCIDVGNKKSVLPLYDYLQGGSGKSFDWKEFLPPKKSRWILAGGLNPENVSEAIMLLNPYGVDVASGVETVNLRKDPLLVRKFIHNVKRLEVKI